MQVLEVVLSGIFHEPRNRVVQARQAQEAPTIQEYFCESTPRLASNLVGMVVVVVAAGDLHIHQVEAFLGLKASWNWVRTIPTSTNLRLTLVSPFHVPISNLLCLALLFGLCSGPHELVFRYVVMFSSRK